GTRRIAFEAERTFDSGPFTRLFGSIGLSRRENPHFSDTPDRRTTWFARAERRLPAHVMVAADVTRASVRFGPDRARFWSPGVDVAFDTRRDPAFPSDAVLLQARWDSLRQPDEDGIRRYSLDARGYKRVIGQTVAAVRARLDRADAPLPPWEAWLLGGAGSVRGIRAGAFAGDQRFVASAEVRVPLSSPLGSSRAGFTVFADVGAVAPHGERLRDATTQRGGGAGLFLVTPVLTLNLEVARGTGDDTRVHFSTGFAF
ncbi:MAG TPA: BamA/TamA family outer membrane protein, partial [Vicinamibacterales bacterium]|nr:BamA/TamA family outer membrane protein [Vicinamibacterales bacterium]